MTCDTCGPAGCYCDNYDGFGPSVLCGGDLLNVFIHENGAWCWEPSPPYAESRRALPAEKLLRLRDELQSALQVVERQIKDGEVRDDDRPST